MITLSGIILVDDNVDELNELHQSFVSAGYPCLAIKYDNDSADNVSGIDHVDLSIMNPRVIITDLNLNEESSFGAKSLVAPIGNLLRKITKDGPYILYFWSKNKDKVDEVMSLLESREAFSDIQLPIKWGIIDKSQFSSNAAGLKAKIQNLISESPVFHALFDWENRVAKASQETTNSLYVLTKPLTRANYQSAHTENLQNMLAAIGNETLGTKNALDHPNTALDAGLAPVLNDRLMGMQTGKGCWVKAVPNIGKNAQIEESQKPALNSFYHVEIVKPNFPKNKKGVFVKISDEVLDDGDSRAKFEDKLGQKLADIMMNEFLSDRKLENKTRPEMRTFRAEAISNIILGFIELSADCDQAQRKVRLHKYVLAALIPIKYKDITIFGSGDKERNFAHEGIYRAPTIKIGDDEFILKLSFKYQIGTIPLSKVNGSEYSNKWFGDPIFRLKEQILGDISFRCAQYSTRPGIVSF